MEEFLLDCRPRRLAPKRVSWYAGNLRYFHDWLMAQGGADQLSSFTLQNAPLQPAFGRAHGAPGDLRQRRRRP